jgi:hypothetical protein
MKAGLSVAPLANSGRPLNAICLQIGKTWIPSDEFKTGVALTAPFIRDSV